MYLLDRSDYGIAFTLTLTRIASWQRQCNGLETHPLSVTSANVRSRINSWTAARRWDRGQTCAQRATRATDVVSDWDADKCTLANPTKRGSRSRDNMALRLCDVQATRMRNGRSAPDQALVYVKIDGNWFPVWMSTHHSQAECEKATGLKFDNPAGYVELLVDMSKPHPMP